MRGTCSAAKCEAEVDGDEKDKGGRQTFLGTGTCSSTRGDDRTLDGVCVTGGPSVSLRSCPRRSLIGKRCLSPAGMQTRGILYLENS